MSRTFSTNAIVLRVHDVGEADRFCILLTRDRGRLAARARGVRKIKSRMGGSLLPFATARVELTEGSAGYLLTSAVRSANPTADMNDFLRASQATELILFLIQDGEPVPDIYDLLAAFLSENHSTMDAFTLCVLHALGLLPESHHVLLGNVSTADRLLLDTCIREKRLDATFSPQGSQALRRFSDTVIEQQSSRKPRAREMIQMIAN